MIHNGVTANNATNSRTGPTPSTRVKQQTEQLPIAINIPGIEYSDSVPVRFFSDIFYVLHK